MQFTESEASEVASEMQNELKGHPWMRVLFTGAVLYGEKRTALGDGQIAPHMTLLGRLVYENVPWFNDGLKVFDGVVSGTIFTYQSYVAANDGMNEGFKIVGS